MLNKSKISSLLHNKTIRNGGLFSIFSFFQKGVAFLLMIVLARYITPEEYGELSLFNTCVMFLGYIVGLSTAGYLSVAYFKLDKEDFKKDFTSICTITVVVLLIIALLFITFHNQLAELLKIPVPFLYIGVAVSFFHVFVNLNLDYLRIQEKVSKYGLLSCLFALIMSALTLCFVIGAGQNWAGRVYADLITSILFGLIAVVCFVKQKLFDFNIDWPRCKVVILWGLPIIPHLASAWIKLGLDRYIVEYSHTMADVGIFSFAMSLTSIMVMVGTAFNQTNSVNLYQTLSSNLSKEDKLRRLRRKEKYISLSYLLVAVVTIIFVSLMVPLFMPNYTASIPYVFILTIYGFFRCIYFLYCNYLFYYSKTKNLMYITFGTSILHLVLSLLFTRYSLFYTCAIYVISEIAICVFTYSQSKKCIREYLT